MMTGSRRWIAYESRIRPPVRLSHQNATGTTEVRFFSEATHCTRNRAVKTAWPRKPSLTQGERSRSTCHRSESRRDVSDIVQTSWPTPGRAGDRDADGGQGTAAAEEGEGDEAN